eukprot:TRINITY_DN960_c0_g1_i1.p1 TRINITY_DN960_c0_g1~~TRINITY_DN960_c0_g1_i1.p1  ORF type:complete len:732 (-),score=320.84 TRINITY_DN960_c0_g1_i1:83-2278(-)
MKKYVVASLLAGASSFVAAGDVGVQKTLQEPADGKDSKMAAVNKVIEMLEGLQKQVLDEGETEAKTYNKFSCFCKDTISEKHDSIQTGEDEKTSLSTAIEEASTRRTELDTQIEELQADITEAEKKMKEAVEKRNEELKVYERNSADLSGALDALKGAIAALKASKPAFIQVKDLQSQLQKAMLMAEALGLGGATSNKVVTALLQESPGPDIPMEDYKFHSDDVVSMLEKLETDFRAEKTRVDEDESKAAADHDTFMQEQKDIVKDKTKEMEDAQKTKAEKQAKIATDSEQLSVVAATVLDDQKYLQELAIMCNEKAMTWDQRTKVRQDELSALTSAITIIKEEVGEKTTAATIRFAQQGVAVRVAQAVAKNPAAMEAMEADAEAADDEAPSFLQQNAGFLARVQPRDGAREALVSMLRNKGEQLKSTLLASLVSHAMEDPFAKVRLLIQELIERLLKEAGNEANQKGWCDKSIKDAKQKRDYAAEAVAEHNAAMAELEALRDKLTEETTVLKAEIKDLENKTKVAEEMRAAEKAENEETIKVAGEGLDAVSRAIDILDKFYKTAAKEKVFLQTKQGPGSDAPDAGFDSGEAYKGAGAGAGGVIGMLEVIKSDFERTVSETESAEKAAEQEHLKFMTDTGISIAQKTEAEKQKTSELVAAEGSLEEHSDGLNSENEILNGAIKELLDLQPACVDTAMSYEERVARREDEIGALKKGLCILENFNAGGADAC